MYYQQNQKPRGLAAYQPAGMPQASAPKAKFGLLGLPTADFGGSSFAPPAAAPRTTPIQMAQPPAGTYRPVPPPPTLAVPSGHLGQQMQVSTAPGTGGSQGLANQGYGAAPGVGNYGGAPAATAAMPNAANIAPFEPGGLGSPTGGGAYDQAMAGALADFTEQSRKNTALRDAELARLGGLTYDPTGAVARGLAGQARAAADQGARDAVHAENDAIKRMMAGGGLLAQADLNNQSDNFRAGVANQQAGLAADYATRGTAWEQWRDGQRAQLLGSDLGGSQSSAAFGLARQGATLSSELDQMRAQTQNMVAQGRINAAQAQQAEDIAKNQGWYAALEFLIKIAPGALALGAALL